MNRRCHVRASATPRRRRRGVRLSLFLAVCVGLTAGVLRWSSGETDFQLKHVNVHGIEYLTLAEIEGALGPIRGDSAVWLRLPALRGALKSKSRIATVQTYRKLPDAVEIEVHERVPMAVLEHANRRWDIDHTGQILGRSRVQAGYPRIHPVSPAQRGRIRWAVSVLKSAEEVGFAVSDVAFDAISDGVVVQTQYPCDIWLAESQATSLFDFVPAVLADVERRRETPNALDCRFSGQIIVVF